MHTSKTAQHPRGVQKIINGHTITVVRGVPPEGLERRGMLRAGRVNKTGYLLDRAKEAGAKPVFHKRWKKWFVGELHLERWASNHGIEVPSRRGALYNSPASSGHAI